MARLGHEPVNLTMPPPALAQDERTFQGLDTRSSWARQDSHWTGRGASVKNFGASTQTDRELRAAYVSRIYLEIINGLTLSFWAEHGHGRCLWLLEVREQQGEAQLAFV